MSVYRLGAEIRRIQLQLSALNVYPNPIDGG